MKTPKEIAEGIVASGTDCPTPVDWQRQCRWMQEKIAAAIEKERNSRPPKGYVLTDDGVVRKWEGPTTQDRVVLLPGMDVWIVRSLARIGKIDGYGRCKPLNDRDDPYSAKTACVMSCGEVSMRASFVDEYSSMTHKADLAGVFSTREAAEAEKNAANKEAP